MALTVLTSTQAIERLFKKSHKQHEAYLAMYSTWIDGVVKDPSLMVVPVDDHMVLWGEPRISETDLRRNTWFCNQWGLSTCLCDPSLVGCL